ADYLALLCDDVAWHYVEAPPREGFPKGALALAEKMVEIEPYNANYQDTLGAARYRAGKFAEAVACLEGNLESGPEFGGIDIYFLAMSYHQLGEAPSALDAFARAVRWQEEKGSTLSQGQQAELNAFRAEAEALLKGR